MDRLRKGDPGKAWCTVCGDTPADRPPTCIYCEFSGD